jgi:stress response protein YsnF
MNSLNPSKPDNEPSVSSASEAFVIPVLREEAQVDILLEHLGTVRVRKVVHQVNEPVSAAGYREVVETTRVPVNQVVPELKPPWHNGDVLVIPVYEERLVKQLVLREEIHVTRRRESFEGSASASVRREEVIVERLDPETGQWIPEAT